MPFNRLIGATASVVALGSTLSAQSPDSALARLESRIAALESSRATTGPSGFTLESRDRAFRLRLRGLLQSDVRMLDGTSGPANATTLLLRRARPIVEATTFRILDLRFVPDFGNGRAEVFDAHLDVRFRPWLSLRSGKFKPPIGLERLQGAADILFVERGLPTNLVPQRDLGLQLSGVDRAGRIELAVGAFNGAADLGSADADNGSRKDVVARLFTHPFRGRSRALDQLGVGIAASTGAQDGTTAQPWLPAYRAASQQVVFAYRADGTAAGTSVATGDRRRVAPQGYWYVGPVGMMGEYTRSSHGVRRGATVGSLTHTAWQLALNAVLTGEKASFRAVAPRSVLDGTSGHGALEIAARVGRLDLDPDAFPVFADPAVAVRRATGIGAAAIWHLAPAVKMTLHLEQTAFAGGGAAGDRADERVALIRLQHAY